MKTSLFIFSLITLLVGCKKKGEGTYTIKGRVVLDCNNQPVANKDLFFFQGISMNLLTQTSGGDLGSTITDASGYFTFSYKSLNGYPIKIQTAPGSTIMESVPGDTDVLDLIAYYRPQTTVKVNLNVSKQYSVTDTLYIKDYRNLSFLKVIGPFTQGHLYTAPAYGILNYHYSPTNYQEVLVYKIGNSSNWSKKSFQVFACDTSRVTVDIN